MIWFAGGVISGFLILVYALFVRKEPAEQKDFSPKVYRNLMILLTILFGFLLIFKVTEIPAPYHIDEVGIAYDASAIAKYHCDRFLYRFPVLFKSLLRSQSKFAFFWCNQNLYIENKPAVMVSENDF